MFIIGRLTADPQLRSTAGGQPVASFSVATNRTWTDKAGAKQEQAEFHNVVVWGRQAETTSQYLTKGAMVLVEGRLQTRTWQNRENQNVKTTEIIAERVQFGPRAASHGGKSNFSGGARGSARQGKADESEEKVDELPTIDIDEHETKADDLPF